MASDAEILGRDEMNDLDAILAVKPDWDATIREVQNNADTIFTWDYERSRTPLSKLYEKAKIVAVERHDRSAVGDRRRPGEARGDVA